jgi:aminomethyltransferase
MSTGTLTPIPERPPLELQRTPLYPVHQRLGAHLVPFAGWEMPLYYQSIRAEHEAVRSGVGIFDVSHMGIQTLTGASAAGLLSRRTTADVTKLSPGRTHYTFLLNLAAQMVDDLLITRLDAGGESIPSYLAVPNAARAARILELFRQHRRPDTRVEAWNHQVAILAVQGPGSRDLLTSVLGWRLEGLKFYEGRLFPGSSRSAIPVEGRLGAQFPRDLLDGIWVSRTGYTGELGYELFVRGEDAPSLFDRLLAAGAVPSGLGARDTLRLEKGYLLSGQDFDRDHTPLEAGQERFVTFDHPFVGREALEKQQREGVPVRLTGIRIDAPGAIPRHGTAVLANGAPVATVTSGGLSPTLNVGIALAYLPPPLQTPGIELTVDLRGRQVPARVVPLPFLPAPAKRA